MLPWRRSGGRKCVICKAPARYQNVAVTTCEACKAFYRRACQNDLQKTYRCYNGGNCEIDTDSRRSCNFCRFQQCLDAGMGVSKKKNQREIVAVGHHQNKNRVDQMELAAQELFEELLTLTTCYIPAVDGKGKFFSMMEIFDLDSLNSKYSHSFHNIPIADKYQKSAEMTVEKYTAVIAGVIHRLAFFANSLAQFTELGFSDRDILFKGACAEVCMINAVIAFNKDQGLWLVPMNDSSRFYKNVPGLECRVLEQIMGTDVYEEKLSLTLSVQRYHPDETVIMLLYAILLFSPTRANLVDVHSIHKSQIHFAMLLKKYLNWRFGAKEGDNIFLTLTKLLKGFRRVGPFVYQTVHGPILEHPNFNYAGLFNV